MRTRARSRSFHCSVMLIALLLTAPAATLQGKIAVVGGTLVNGDDAAPLENAVILVEGDRIVAVGAAGEVAVPDGFEVVSAAGSWIVPGLIDAHIHIFQSGGLYTRPDVIDLRALRPYAQELALIRQDLDDTLQRYLRCGVTGVADVGGPFWNFEVRDLARSLDAAPRVAVTGPLISTYQPEELTTDDPPILEVKTPEEARALVRRQLPHAPDFIKIWFIVGPGQSPADHLELVRATIEESHAAGVRVAVHATELETARAAVEAGADILVHGVFEGEVDDAFVALLKERDVIYTPTLMVVGRYSQVLTQQLELTAAELALADPFVLGTLSDLSHIPAEDRPEWHRSFLDAPSPLPEPIVGLANLKKIHDGGVTVAMGTDAGNIGTLHGPSVFREMELMRQAGLSNREVLRAATRGGARVMGLEDELGLVAPGLLADFVVVAGDPLEDLGNLARVELVVKGGRAFSPAQLASDGNTDLVQRQLVAYNARDLEAFVATYHPEVELFEIGQDQPICTGHAGLRELYGPYFAQTPKLHCEILERIVLDGYVIDYERVTGSQDRGTIEAVAIYEVEDGLLRRVWFVE